MFIYYLPEEYYKSIKVQYYVSIVLARYLG